MIKKFYDLTYDCWHFVITGRFMRQIPHDLQMSNYHARSLDVAFQSSCIFLNWFYANFVSIGSRFIDSEDVISTEFPL
jgi:hypothetical protein